MPRGVVASEFAIKSAKGPIARSLTYAGSRMPKNIATDTKIFGWGPGPQEAAAPEVTASNATTLVLPFTVQDQELAWLADGCADAVTTGLSRFSWFPTLPTAASTSLKGKRLSTQETKSQFMAHYSLQASIREAGTRVQMNVELVDLSADSPLWTDQIDISEDPFAFEDRITHAILAELAPRLLSAEERRVKFSSSGEAWDFVLQR